MRRLYEEKPDIKEFDGVVESCVPGKAGKYLVVLEETAFYPEGGGQPFDTGILGQARVEEVHEKEGRIVHTTDQELKEGQKVHGVIDWERRRQHMQNHTGEHIYSGLVHSRYGYDNVGFHMGKDGVTIDFNGVLTMDQAIELEREANRLVWRNIPVKTWYPGPEELHSLDYRSKKELKGQVRIVEIEGGDVCACCGTHVTCTGEIGAIKITGLKKYKGGVRLEMVCGAMAMADYEKKQEQVARISGLLSVKQGETADGVKRLLEEADAQKGMISRLYQQIFDLRCAQMPESEVPLLVVMEELPPVQLRSFCTLLCRENKGEPVLALGGGEGQYHYVLGSREEKAGIYSKKLNDLLQGRGNGKGPMAQGIFQTEREQIEKVWKERLWKE